jgi:ribonuclease HII
MKEYDTLYPLYGFSSHKGYGTKVHMENLKRFGPCAIHRKTFAPVSALLIR